MTVEVVQLGQPVESVDLPFTIEVNAPGVTGPIEVGALPLAATYDPNATLAGPATQNPDGSLTVDIAAGPATAAFEGALLIFDIERDTAGRVWPADTGENALQCLAARLRTPDNVSFLTSTVPPDTGVLVGLITDPTALPNALNFSADTTLYAFGLNNNATASEQIGITTRTTSDFSPNAFEPVEVTGATPLVASNATNARVQARRSSTSAIQQNGDVLRVDNHNEQVVLYRYMRAVVVVYRRDALTTPAQLSIRPILNLVLGEPTPGVTS